MFAVYPLNIFIHIQILVHLLCLCTRKQNVRKFWDVKKRKIEIYSYTHTHTQREMTCFQRDKCDAVSVKLGFL